MRVKKLQNRKRQANIKANKYVDYSKEKQINYG